MGTLDIVITVSAYLNAILEHVAVSGAVRFCACRGREMNYCFCLVACLGLLASGCTATDSLSPNTDDAGDDVNVFTGSTATGLDIDKISLNQGVDITLWENGEAQAPTFAPVLARRGGVMRVFVDRHDGFEDRDIKGVLTMKNGDELTYLEDVAFIDEDSKQNKLASTINFYFDPDVLLVNTEVTIELIEVDESQYSGEVGDVRIPEEGSIVLGAKATDTVEVVLLPVQYR